MAERHPSTTLNEIRALQEELRLQKEALARTERTIAGSGGGGTYDGMSERLGKLEVRADGVERRLDSIDGKLDRIDGAIRDVALGVARLPSKEALITSILAVVGISLALAIAIAALTFNIADYASKAGTQAEQTKATAPLAPQPIIITLPQPAGPTPIQGSSVAPSSIPATTQPRP